MIIAQEIGFNERFALSENRLAVLAELIPGTETHFYYHCLHCQTTGKLAEARGFLDAWIAKVGINEQTQRMQTRQFILEYSSNAPATLNHLRSEFGINVDHPAPQRDEAAILSTKLDLNALNWDTLFRSYANNLGNVENSALSHAIPFLNEETNLRSWLQRIDRPDVPGLVGIIERELKMEGSRGFGWAPIHNQLTTAQLIDLQKRIPILLESNAYVQARLRRIRPDDDRPYDDSAALREHLEALESFVSTLPESQNSLKANVIYHRLLWDEKSGNFNRARFLRYLELPSNRSFVNAEYAAQLNNRPQIDFSANYKGETMLDPISDDSALVRRTLEHFFQTDTNVDAFSSFIDRDFLTRVYASTKILYGIGEAKTYYAQLSPVEQRDLQSRIELNFSANNPKHYRPSDTVRLTVDLKNTPELLVKIYRLNPRNILSQQKQPIATSIDLDGLVSNVERRIAFAQAPDRRHREVIELPELDGGGAWVVDILAGGLRSRTLINKGHLQAIQRLTNAGSVFRIVDGDGNHVPTAKALFGTREFAPEADGNIVIPFGREVQHESLVLSDGPVASVQPFVLHRESYQLKAGFLVDPQSLLAGSKATLAIRPVLLCNDQMVSLSQLEKPELAITTTDLDGIIATQNFSDIQLSDASEFTKAFLVPPRLAGISLTLSGKVLQVSNDSRVPVSASHSVTINETARTARIRDFYVTQTDKGYLLEVRGRNGEPGARLPIQLDFKLIGIVPTTSIRLATNERGIVDLGELANVERLNAVSDSMDQRSFHFGPAYSAWPANYHSLKGQTIEVALSSVAGVEPLPFAAKATEKSTGRYGLIEYRGGFVWALHSEKVSVANGLLQIAGLEPGSYRLTDYASGRTMQISVVEGKEQADLLVGQNRILESNRVRPVHVKEVLVDASKLEIRVGNPDPFTRVHVVADAFLPIVGHGTSLPAPDFSLTTAQRMRVPSFYINSMKLDEEYQYVLQRQFAKKYLGSHLPQPSAILNPWELAVTQNASQSAAAGDPMASEAAPLGPPSQLAIGVEDLARQGTGGLPDYAFLKRGSMILVNGRCDEMGVLSVDREAFHGLSSVTVIVVHPSGMTYRRVALPLDEGREFTDRRLAKSFPATDRLTEIQSVRVLRVADKHDLGDASSTRVKVYGSVSDVYQLYKSLLPNQPDFDKFNCLTQWSALKDEQKEIHYSDLACHELNLFLMVHDKPFFQRVIHPYLSNKMQKQFMDDYLLGEDLVKYVKPWKLAQLNCVERILLAKSLDQQSASTKRWLGDFVRASKINSAAQSKRFATALMQTALGDVELLTEEFASLHVTDGTAYSHNSGIDMSYRYRNRASEMGGGGGAPTVFFGDAFENDFAPIAAGDEPVLEESKKSASKQWSSTNRAYGGSRLSLGAQLGTRIRLYETLESTRKWAESNYFRLPLQNQSPNLVKANTFWFDFLNHSAGKPFLSEHLDLAASNLHEALLALAVLELPLKSEPAVISPENGRLVVTNATDAVVFIQGIHSVEVSSELVTALASQNVYLADDPVETAKPVQTKSLIQGTVYRLRVVLTNPSAAMVSVNVLQQIPQGAIALEGAKTVSGHKLDLAPFATQELTIKFYFPTAGDFQLYGAQITVDGKLAIAAPSIPLKVLVTPDSVDETSWSFVAAWGTKAQVLEFLSKANLFQIDLEAIAWRMADRTFYEDCLRSLSEFGNFNATLWAYSLKHNDAPRLREYLEKSDVIVARVGAVLDADIMKVDPVDRLWFEHVDFRPLIVARTHQLGPKRVILNDGLAIQYERLLTNLSNQKRIDVQQRLALVYYMLLQNRTEEAIAHFAKIDANLIVSQLQYDYFAAYLDMLQGKFEEANLRSAKYVAYPNPRWRDWFAQVLSQIAERKAIQAGKVADIPTSSDWKTDAANRILSGGREQQNQNEAERLPILDLIQESEKIVLRHRNCERVEIHYYLMDVELLFSRSPFSQQDGGGLNSIEPNVSEKLALTKSDSTKDVGLEIPEKLRNKNVVIEVNGGGLTRNLVVYANSLVVNHSPNMGRLQVLTKQGLRPLEGTYVKVYARDRQGAVKFYKDGYTDLRGQFDYTGLSTNDLDATQKFSLLILHPEHGTMVRETEPPKR